MSYLLELKPGKAGETFARFAVNTTAGVAGLFDVAKRRPFNLPRRPNGFADALGYYGVKPGPFLFLPLIGPTTVRDMIGGAADRLVLPMAFGTPFNRFAYSAGTGALSALDRRIAFDDRLRSLRDTSNPYAARRALYLEMRKSEIKRLHSPRPTSRLTLDEPADAADILGKRIMDRITLISAFGVVPMTHVSRTATTPAFQNIR